MRTTGCSLEDVPKVMDDRDEWQRESQGNPCKEHNMMLMIIRLNYRII